MHSSFLLYFGKVLFGFMLEGVDWPLFLIFHVLGLR